VVFCFSSHCCVFVCVCSKFDLRRLCTAVGATPLVRLGKPLPEELGSCSSVRTEEFGSTQGKQNNS
jgi:T-complex protein 1 subunit theta